MRVVINAQLDPHRSGGIAQVLVGLAHGLSRLHGSDEYVFVCSPASAAWLAPHVTANARIVVNERRTPAPIRGPRHSDGFWESFDPDVLHFPYQSYTLTDVPTVYNPHDLQHLHLPDLFTPEERARRDALYGEACAHADTVVVASEWVRRDVIRQLDVDPARVEVVEWGAPTTVFDRPNDADVDVVLARFELTAGYALYPAQTWPHKNHARLIDAIALLRDRGGPRVALVCTGTLTEHAAGLREQVVRLGLTGSVQFLGRLDERDLLALYRRARMVVVPTLFEAVSFPIYEAFAERVPVACSNVTSLPDQVGDAAVVFDPHSTDAIADAMERVYSENQLRAQLVSCGAARVAKLTWDRTAAAYRTIYRLVARRRDVPMSRTLPPGGTTGPFVATRG